MTATFSSKHGAAQFFPVIRIAGDAAVRAPVALNKPVCVVGRRWGVNLPLENCHVSKVHAMIVRQRDGVYVRDLASRNGITVNGSQVREMKLGPGDAIRIGPYVLQCASGFAQTGGNAGDGSTEGKSSGDRAAPPAILEIDDGPGRAAMDGCAVVIGRRPECDVVLDDDRVSPVHAVVFTLDGKRLIRDLNSGGGTVVNGQRIHQQELHDGDEVRIGGTRLRYTVAADRSPADADITSPGGGEISPLESEPEDMLIAVQGGEDTTGGAEDQELIPLHDAPQSRGLVDDAVGEIERASASPPPDLTTPVGETAGEADLAPIPLAAGGPADSAAGLLPPGPSARPGAAPEGPRLPGSERGDAADQHQDQGPNERPVGYVVDESRDEPDQADYHAKEDDTEDLQESRDAAGREASIANRTETRSSDRRGAATEKLDQIVSTLSDNVADLAQTWREVRQDTDEAANPDADHSAKPPGS